MEDTRLYRYEIWLESDQELGRFEWMSDIGLTTLAYLSIMCFSGKYIRIPDRFCDGVSLSLSEIYHHRIDDLMGKHVTKRIVHHDYWFRGGNCIHNNYMLRI